MQVLCVYKGKYPDGMAMANRLRFYAEALSHEGIALDVASEGQRGGPRSTWQTLRPGHRVWHWRQVQKLDSLPFVRDVAGALYRVKLFVHVWRSPATVIFCCGYPWTTQAIFCLLARLSGKRFAIELNELPYSILVARLDTEWGNRLKRWLAFHLVYPWIDGFLVISGALGDVARRHGSPKATITQVPILTDGADLPPRSVETVVAPYIFHAGTLTEEKDGISTVVEAFAKCAAERPQLRFEFSNYTTLPSIKQRMEAIFEAYQVRDRVTFHRHLSRETLQEKLLGCTFVVVNKPDNLRNRHNFSTKLGEYMSLGLPIITTATGDAAQYLVDGENCLLIADASDSDEIAHHMRTLLDDPELARTLGENARRTSQASFAYARHASALGAFFQTLGDHARLG